MRPLLMLCLFAAPLCAQAPKEEKPGAQKAQPVDLGKVLRESKEFAKKCKQHKITFEEGKVTAVGQIAYRGGGPCEYLVSVYPVKGYETIVLLDDGPKPEPADHVREYVKGLASTLNNAMLAAGFKKGKALDWDDKTRKIYPPTGQTVYLYVEWTGTDKKTHRARLCDWLWNFKTKAQMAPGKLVYTGSVIYDEGPPTHKKWFGAEVDGLIVSALSTRSTLIDDTEDGALDNGTYEGVPERIPESGTRVKIIFSAKPIDYTEHYTPLKPLAPMQSTEPASNPLPAPSGDKPGKKEGGKDK